jgi:2-C-methyl-D-erythritol 4-phosphate cytidylyltransferase/2-C-methyl-D-erythritol 2,4-cyclodiphosphate synthase
MATAAIIPAGGTGRRMGGGLPKQYLPAAGVPILVRTLRTFQNSPVIDEIILAVPPQDREKVRRGIVESERFSKVSLVLAGGNERQDTVRNALRHLREDHSIVVIHDGVRPFVTEELLQRSVEAALACGAVTTGIAVKDTVKEVGKDGQVIRTVPRQGLWLTQTPQAFRREILLSAYERAAAEGFYGTDDAMLVERMGVPVRMIPGSLDNIKVTTPEDLLQADLLGRRPSPAGDSGKGSGTGFPFYSQEALMRIGFGYDSHRLVAGRKLVLGGKEIPFEKGLQGHSDADVLVHAVCDAILGALGEGDIGRHFPDTDPAYKDISSLRLLERVRIIATAKQCRIIQVDTTVVMEKPKLAPYMAEMVANIAAALCLPCSQVSVKAKTNEGMGSVGQGEGAAAFAVVNLSEGQGT